MNLLIIADDEYVDRHVPECSADLLISCGDLADDIILSIGAKCKCHEILAVKGNHDSSAPFRDPIRDLHLATYVFRGVNVGGFCGSWKYKPKGNYLFEHHEVADLLKGFPPVDVFVAHNSPRLIHDRDDAVHEGFTAFNTYLADAKPRLFLHGHQHENRETFIDTTRVVGTFGHRFFVLPD
jgi:Icc-related predicted phosphoesterase